MYIATKETVMQVKVQAWGNSLGARIPASFAAQLRLENNTLVDMRVEGRSIVITPAKPRYSLDDLLAQMDSPAEAIDTGAAQGREIW
jgi:antitoxin MazE